MDAASRGVVVQGMAISVSCHKAEAVITPRRQGSLQGIEIGAIDVRQPVNVLQVRKLPVIGAIRDGLSITLGTGGDFRGRLRIKGVYVLNTDQIVAVIADIVHFPRKVVG